MSCVGIVFKQLRCSNLSDSAHKTVVQLSNESSCMFPYNFYPSAEAYLKHENKNIIYPKTGVVISAISLISTARQA